MAETLVIACCALLLLAVWVGTVEAASAPKPPCWGLALDGYPLSDTMIETAEKEVTWKPRIVVFFLQWPSIPREADFPLESLHAVARRGAIPCITWEPMYYQDGREMTISHERILDGSYDIYLSSFARAAKQWGKPVIIRFAHEMNLERYHWGTDKGSYGHRSPEIYRSMFRHVVDAFRKAGASNVLWAFCPNAESLPNLSFDPDASWNDVDRYYPGNDYVDLIGADGYNWGTTQTREKHGWDSRWKSFQDIFRPIHEQLRTLAPHKPFIIFETATVTQGGDKKLWIRDAIRATAEWGIQGIVWFHVRKEEDWRFHSRLDDPCAAVSCQGMDCSTQWLEKPADKRGDAFK